MKKWKKKKPLNVADQPRKITKMSDTPAGLNSPQYVVSDLTSVSQQVTIEAQYQGRCSRIIVDNTLGTTGAFVVSGKAAQTAVYPTSATVASLGSIVGPGTVQSWTFDSTHNFIAAIRESGTADLPIKLATGE